MQGHYDAVHELIERGADIAMRGSYNLTPLEAAIRHGGETTAQASAQGLLTSWDHQEARRYIHAWMRFSKVALSPDADPHPGSNGKGTTSNLRTAWHGLLVARSVV
jgi:ankyrin repeat protein